MLILEREIVPSNIVNDQDQGALTSIAAALGLTTTGIFFCIRLLIRWPWQSLFGGDDAAILVASVSGTIHSIVLVRAVSMGLGKQSEGLTAEGALAVRKAIFASDILYVWALFWSKLAVCVLIQRLCISRRHRRQARMLVIGCVILGLLSLLVIGIRQHSKNPWSVEPTTADSTLQRWIVVESFACIIDLAVALAPVALVWSLQMERSHKVWVVLGFAARLPTISLAVLRLKSLSQSLQSTELIFDRAVTEMLTAAELTFSIISATVPCLRIFMQSVNTGLLGKSTFNESEGDRSNASYFGSKSGNFESTSRSHDRFKSRNRVHLEVDEDTIELQDRSRWGETVANAIASSDKQSVRSDGSEKAIIVKQTVDVVYT